MPGPTPVLSPLVVCDTIIHDRDTNKPSLIGVFSWIAAHQFPVQHPCLCVYSRVTDAQGDYVFRLELVRLESMEIIGEANGEAKIPDRLMYNEIIFELNGLVFPAVGQYEFRLYADGTFLGHQAFEVVQAAAD